jgi:hypothetical protein
MRRFSLGLGCFVACAMVAANGCAANDDIAQTEPMVRTRPVQDVPLAAAQAVALFDRVQAGVSLETIAQANHAALPVERLDGKTTHYLTFSSPRPIGRPVEYILSVKNAEVDLPGHSVALVGAVTSVSPLGLRANHAHMLLLLRDTLQALDAGANFKRLVEVSDNVFLVEDTAGALFELGKATPLSADERRAFEELNNRRLREEQAHKQSVSAELSTKWAALLGDGEFQVAGRSPSQFALPDGSLDYTHALSDLRASAADKYIAARMQNAEQVDAEREANEAASKGGGLESKAITNADSACTQHFLWWCVAWNKFEKGAYDPSCVGHPRPHTCEGNKNSRAVAHVELNHPATISGKRISYSGCGPESFAAMAWRRYVNGDDNFGFQRGATPAESSYNGWASTQDPNSFMYRTANAAAVAMGTFRPFDSDQGLTWPWDYTNVNTWLNAQGSRLRVRGSYSYFLGNLLPWVANEKAEIVHRLIGREQGPLVAGGFVGPGPFIYHYAPAFGYRITRLRVANAVDVITDMTVSVDYPVLGGTYEMPMVNGGVAFAGLYYFEDDFNRSSKR